VTLVASDGCGCMESGQLLALSGRRWKRLLWWRSWARRNLHAVVGRHIRRDDEAVVALRCHNRCEGRWVWMRAEEELSG
jgi:hypothetical protein